MKSKFGTALALVGVLLTGTAAAAINTQALISPSQSTLGTAATTLLPIDQTIEVVPGQTSASPQTQTLSASPAQSTTASAPATKLPVSLSPTAGVTAPKQPSTSITSAASSPSVVYGNPNPATGDDDDDDDEDDDDEDDDEDDD